MILRDPNAAAGSRHDLIVIGGGFHGVSLALEAARRGLRPLLIEAGDFGHATSWNSHRIVHGGLRYLQSLDLRRFFQSVAERRRFLQDFPDLVEIQACLMPLYGDGLYRPSVLRAALELNDLLSWRRNAGLRLDRQVPCCRLLDRPETIALNQATPHRGLLGGAMWFDASLADPARALIEMLHWACRHGATALNYVRSVGLLSSNGRVCGVIAEDSCTGDTLEFRSPLVVNCAGPWCSEVALKFDPRARDLFHPSLAFNVVLDRPPVSTAALAVSGGTGVGRHYFLHQWKGRLLAGTYHAPADKQRPFDAPGTHLVGDFLAALNVAVPSLNTSPCDVMRVFWGLLPAATPGSDSPAKRDVIHAHAAADGPCGLFTVSGVKFTTARHVAERVLSVAMPGRRLSVLGAAQTRSDFNPQPVSAPEFFRSWATDRPKAAALARRIVREESVVRLDDLLERRTDWGVHPQSPPDAAERVAALLPPGQLLHRQGIPAEDASITASACRGG